MKKINKHLIYEYKRLCAKLNLTNVNIINDLFSLFFTKKKLITIKIESREILQKHRGISLIENIATILILATALSAASYLLWTMMTSVEENKKRVTAVYLAQECSELTRNIRDTAWRQNLPWNCGFFENSTNTIKSGIFKIKNNKNIIASDMQGITGGTIAEKCQKAFGVFLDRDTETDLFKTNYQLKLDAGNFQYDTGIETPFFRRVVISKADNNDSDLESRLKATCEVGWTSRQGNQKIEISQILTNWK